MVLSALPRLFFSGDITELSESDLEQLKQDGLPSSTIKRSELEGRAMTQLFTDAGMVKSGKQVKDALSKKAVFINGMAYGAESNMNLPQCFALEKAMYGRFFYCETGQENSLSI